MFGKIGFGKILLLGDNGDSEKRVDFV